MTPYCGRHSCKVYLHNKPIRFGYKHFSICSADGYPYKTIPYPDKSFDKNKPQHLEAVTKLLDVVDDETRIDLYFDSFYASEAVMQYCTDNRIAATGTFQANRIHVDNVMPVEEMNKKAIPRGHFDFANNGHLHA